jgi:hypothetical protein
MIIYKEYAGHSLPIGHPGATKIRIQGWFGHGGPPSSNRRRVGFRSGLTFGHPWGVGDGFSERWVAWARAADMRGIVGILRGHVADLDYRRGGVHRVSSL